MKHLLVSLLMSLIWLPALGQDQDQGQVEIIDPTAPAVEFHPDPPQPHVGRQIPKVRPHDETMYPNADVEPAMCKQVDNLPKDHVLTQEERLLRDDCQPVHYNGGLVWVNPKYIEEDIARNKAQAYAMTHYQGKVVHLTPTVMDKDGHVLDKAAQQKFLMDKWNELHSSGQCAKVAQDLVNHNDQYQQTCSHGNRSGRCMEYSKKIGIVSFCAVSPDDPEHGYKVRAIRQDFMPTAIKMAQTN